MPLLRELKLNNSALSSVRDLGSKLRHLQVPLQLLVLSKSSKKLFLYSFIRSSPATQAIVIPQVMRCMFCDKACIIAGPVGVTLRTDWLGWAQRAAKLEGAVCCLQPY